MIHSWTQWLREKSGTSKPRRETKRAQLYLEYLEDRWLPSNMVFTVNSAGDDPSGPTTGVETLRDAILAVNSDASDNASNPDVINFNIAGTPAITLKTDLPALTKPVTIDGSTPPGGVTVNGQGFAVLTVDSATTEKGVTFSNGSLTVSAGGSLSVVGDLTLGNANGDTTLVNNYGSLSVSGSVVAGDNTGVNNYGTASFNVTNDFTLGDYGYLYNGANFASTDAATFTVGGSFSIGTNGYVYQDGTSALKVTGDLTLGDSNNESYLYNGVSSSDAATLSVGGNLSIGAGGFAFAYNYGTSTLSVGGDFTLGGGTEGLLYNGGSSTDAATLIVGGNLNSGAGGFAFAYNYGTSTLRVGGDFTLGSNDYGYLYNGDSSADAATLTVGGSLGIGAGGYGYAYNYGTSTLRVTGDFTLGSNGFLYNGDSSTDAATLTVGGNFSIGNSGDGADGRGSVYIEGLSTITVNGNFTIYGDNRSSVENGVNSADDTTLTVGGSFNLGANSNVNNNNTSTFSVANSFTVGADSSFNNFGTVVFSGLSTLTVLDGSNLSVESGGQLVAQSLVVEDGGEVDVSGTLLILSPPTVEGSGQIVTEDGGLTEYWAVNPINLTYGTPLDNSQLSNAIDYVNGEQVEGTFAYAPSELSTLLNAGTGQGAAVTFTPSDPTYSSISGAVIVNVSPATPTVHATSESITYNGLAQAYPLNGGDVSVTGVSSGDDQTPAGNFSYSYSSTTAPTNAGTYTVTVTFNTSDPNYYTGATATASFTIGQATSTTTATDANGTYNGLPFAAGGTVTGAGGLSATPTSFAYVGTGSTSYAQSSTPPTNAGTYMVTATYAGDTNHTGSSSAAVPFTISQATSTTTATDAGGNYNGSPFPASGTVTGAGGLTTTPTSFTYAGTGSTVYTQSNTPPTKIGTYTVTASYAGDANHIGGSSAAVAFTISQGSSTTTTTATDAGGTYNGSPFPARGTVTGTGGFSTSPTSFSYVGTGSTKYGPSATAPTNAGTYTVTASYSGDANHTASSSSAVPFTIGKAPSITAIDPGGTYNGSPLAASGTVTGAGGLNTTPSSFSYVGTGSTRYGPSATPPTNAGTYTVTASYSGDTNHTGGSSSAVPFTIAKASSTITASDAGGTYNGSPFAASGMVTGAGGLITKPTSFSYVGTGSTTYARSSTPPTKAGTYTVTASYAGDANHTGGSSAAVPFTIKQATPTITWNNPGVIAYFTPLGSNQLDATANESGSFVYTPAAGTLLTAGTHTLSVKFTPTDSTDYKTMTATVQVVVLGAGVTTIGTKLYFVGGGATSNDHVQVNPAGKSNTGSTGVTVNGTKYNQSFTTIYIFLQGGNDNIDLASTLTINAVVTAGNGNDNVHLGNGNNTVRLGNGNDTIYAGNGMNMVVAGNGNDKVHLGNGSNNNVTLGSGNDTVYIGDGSNEDVTLGNGNDKVRLGNGSHDNVKLGTGNDKVHIGNGSDNIVFLPAKGKGLDHVKFGNGKGDHTISLGIGGGGPV